MTRKQFEVVVFFLVMWLVLSIWKIHIRFAENMEVVFLNRLVRIWPWIGVGYFTPRFVANRWRRRKNGLQGWGVPH